MRPAKKSQGRQVIGIHACRETLKVRPRAVTELSLRERWEDSQTLRALADLAKKSNVPFKSRPPAFFNKISPSHQGVLLTVAENPILNWQALESALHGRLVFLDGITDPQNFGSMLRTAWLLNVDGFILPTDRSVALTPVVCKVASGGAEHVPVHFEPNLPAVAKRLKEMGFWIFGLSGSGTEELPKVKIPEKVVWAVGSEGKGLRSSVERSCDTLVRIPQAFPEASYNAAIALGLALYETRRQR